jgi:hypothetical protein
MFFFKEHLIGKDYEWPENKITAVKTTPAVNCLTALMVIIYCI